MYAAGQQNKLWQMAEALYERQGDENSGWITDAVVRTLPRRWGRPGEGRHGGRIDGG